MKTTLRLSSVSCAVALLAALPGYSDDSITRSGHEAKSAQVKCGCPSRVNKANDLIGMQIRNQQDERLGKVKDVVLDLSSGRIAYVVLSTGGFRPKYLALPPSSFTASSDEKYLVMNADKDKVRSAAGFRGNNWPDMATPSWGAEPFWESPDLKPNQGENYDYDKNLELEDNPAAKSDKESEPPMPPTPEDKNY